MYLIKKLPAIMQTDSLSSWASPQLHTISQKFSLILASFHQVFISPHVVTPHPSQPKLLNHVKKKLDKLWLCQSLYSGFLVPNILLCTLNYFLSIMLYWSVENCTILQLCRALCVLWGTFSTHVSGIALFPSSGDLLSYWHILWVVLFLMLVAVDGIEAGYFWILKSY
jgi:hypothetical protein